MRGPGPVDLWANVQCRIQGYNENVSGNVFLIWKRINCSRRANILVRTIIANNNLKCVLVFYEWFDINIQQEIFKNYTLLKKNAHIILYSELN